MYDLFRVSGPANEPLSLQRAKRHCSVEMGETFFNSWFEGEPNEGGGAIAAARELVESESGLSLMPQTWRLELPGWDYTGANDTQFNLQTGPLDLYRHPVMEVSAIEYYDETGTLKTDIDLDWFRIRRGRFRSALALATTTNTLPSFYTARPYPIGIEYVAGYSTPDDPVDEQRRAVPRQAVMAILLLLAHWFKNREAVAVGTISSDIEQSYRAILRAISVKRYV
jgi:uncharacterized phiE125 gp8 family phage protein